MIFSTLIPKALRPSQNFDIYLEIALHVLRYAGVCNDHFICEWVLVLTIFSILFFHPFHNSLLP